MPCSSESDFFCVTEGTRCHGAIRLQDHPGWTGELLGFVFLKVCESFLQTANTKVSKNLGICPQDLVCCHGCIGELCNPLVYKFSSNQPLIDLLQIAGLPPTTSPESPSPQGFQPYDTSFDLAESTPPSVPNTGTLSPPSTDTTKFGQPSTEATDLIINQNFQQIPGQNIDPNTGKSTSDFFDQAPTRMNLNQGITMPLGNQLETPDLRPAPVLESPSYEVPLKS